MVRLSAAVIVAGGVAAVLSLGDARSAALSACADARAPVRGGTLRGDLDGDGRSDRVRVAARAITGGKCQFRIVVTGAGGWSAFRAFAPHDLQAIPRLLVLARIDATRGVEMVVGDATAPLQGVAYVFTVRHHRLVPLAAPKSPFTPGGDFVFSDGNGEGGGETQVDCGKPGTVVTAGIRWLSTNDPYSPDPRYYAERRTYRITGTRLVQVAATVIPNADRGQAEGVLLSRDVMYRPFPSCAVTAFT